MKSPGRVKPGPLEKTFDHTAAPDVPFLGMFSFRVILEIYSARDNASLEN